MKVDLLCPLGRTHWWNSSLTPLLLGPTAASTAVLYKKQGNEELGGGVSFCLGIQLEVERRAPRAIRGIDLERISPKRNNIYRFCDLCSALIYWIDFS